MARLIGEQALNGAGGVLLAAGFIVALSLIREPTTFYEISVICNLRSEALERPSEALERPYSECIVKELVDNWHYVIGEAGWAKGLTTHSEAQVPKNLFASIAAGETRLTPAYAEFCKTLILTTIANQRAELAAIAEDDPKGGFSMTCPAEESKDDS